MIEIYCKDVLMMF